MSQESISESHRSATHHPLRTDGPRKLYNPDLVPPAQELEDVWTPKIEALEVYIENYVQPLAASVEKLVTQMESFEERLSFLSNRVNELRHQELEDGLDITQLYKQLAELKAATAGTEWTPPGLTPIEISQALSSPLDAPDA